MSNPGTVEIDLEALARNYALIANNVAPSACGAVVKADAYGLGIERVSRRLFRAGCRDFFVACLSEGVELRAILPDARIFVFEGVSAGERETFFDQALIPVLNTLEQIGRWQGSDRTAALHIDTGMNRLGLTASDVGCLVSEPERIDGLEIAYLMTHLACADEPDHPLNALQWELFEELRRVLPDVATSVGNSAAALLEGARCGDLARPGIALYGGNPFVALPNPVEPVVSVRGRVLQVRKLDEAGSVGYGASFAAAAGTRLAVVGVGYADGYLRSLGNRGSAAVCGQSVPVVGRVSMDLLCVDVSNLPDDAVGEGSEVTLIGGPVPLETVAEAAGTINYELLTALGSRLERVYVEEE